ncbi:MAG: Ppx/GppA family phosphatase [Acidimicrobiia bacterium]|nr:Ppx/GppA family phosphatase [Acidimicrobiia bacterium]
MTVTVAAIDCGTNSTRLLVATESDDGSLATIERHMHITRLGEGVNASGRLAPAAIERTLAVLRQYADIVRGHQVDADAVRIAATSACRDAGNRDEFFDAAEQLLGARPELLSGTEEAALSFAGATAELSPQQGPFLVVDIGGGSTEAVYGTTEPEASISLDMGCVRITEQFLHSDPPAPEELSSALSVIAIHIDDLLREIPDASEAATLVGLAGTVSTMAAVEIGLAAYDRDRIHHFELSRAAAEDVFRTLATEASADRRHNPGLEPGRVDVIVGGACVVVQLFRSLGFSSMLVSEADILDGLAASVLSRRGSSDPPSVTPPVTRPLASDVDAASAQPGPADRQ